MVKRLLKNKIYYNKNKNSWFFAWKNVKPGAFATILLLCRNKFGNFLIAYALFIMKVCVQGFKGKNPEFSAALRGRFARKKKKLAAVIIMIARFLACRVFLLGLAFVRSCFMGPNNEICFASVINLSFNRFLGFFLAPGGGGGSGSSKMS